MTAATAALAALTGPGAAHAAAAHPEARTEPQFNGSVYAIAYRGDTMYVGGSFTSATIAGHLVHRERLAAFDTRTGALLGWAPEANDTVRALAVSDNAVYAAGDFTKIGGRRRANLARLDGSSGAVGTLSHHLDGIPEALAVGDGNLYVGGSFTQVDSSARSRLAAFSLYDGAINNRWQPAADDAVHALAFAGHRVYLGGNFRHTDGVSAPPRLSAVDATSGELDKAFRPSVPAMVHGLAVDANGVYAALGGPGGSAAAFTESGRTRWTRAFDGDVLGIAVLGGITYVGGHFARACKTGAKNDCAGGSPRSKLAAVNGNGSLNTWAPRASGIVGVRTIVVDPKRRTVAVGGDFTAISGGTGKRPTPGQ